MLNPTLHISGCQRGTFNSYSLKLPYCVGVSVRVAVGQRFTLWRDLIVPSYMKFSSKTTVCAIVRETCSVSW